MLCKKLVLPISYLSAALALAACGSSETDAPPVVQAGADISLKEGRSAVLTASVSDDKTGYQLKWSQVSGPALQLGAVTGQSLSIKAPAVNEDTTAVVKLTVTDSAGHSVSDELTVSLKNNKLPTITAAAFPAVNEKSQTQLQVSVADPDGTVQNIQWQQLSGPQLQLTDSTTAQVKVLLPAVDRKELVKLRITVTDDDNETTVLEREMQIEPLWQEVHVSGFLAAKQMAGSRVLAVVNDEVFHTFADTNSGYTLALKLDDDAQDDFVLLKAESVAKPGMELLGVVPAVLSQDPTKVTHLTPYSTAFIAMATRANQGVLPYSIDALKQAQSSISAAEVAEAAILIAAFPEQNSVSLPHQLTSVFSSVMQPASYLQFKADMLQQQGQLVDQVQDALPQHGFNNIELTQAELNSGLRLTEVENSEYGPENSRFYQFSTLNRARVADNTFASEGLWSALTGVVHYQADLQQTALQQREVTDPELGLEPELQAQLLEAGIEQLDVKLTLVSERLRRVAQGAGQDLFYRERRIGYQPETISLHGEQIEFLAAEEETADYVWGGVLFPETLQRSEQELAGVWQIPLYAGSNAWFSQQIQLQELVLEQGGEGHSRTSAETFVWWVRLDQNMQAVLSLKFNDGQRLDIRLLNQTESGYQADLLYLNEQSQWLAADHQEIKRL